MERILMRFYQIIKFARLTGILSRLILNFQKMLSVCFKGYYKKTLKLVLPSKMH